MTKELRFYMGGNQNNYLKDIGLCRDKFIDATGECPNKIFMRIEMYKDLLIEESKMANRVIDRTTTIERIFGMEILFNYGLAREEIVIIKEDNMRDDNIDAMRYAMGGFGFYPRDVFGKVERLPKKYIINKGATVLFWEDGSKTVVKRGKDDEYNKVLGFLWAYFQKTSGLSRTKANKYLAGLVDEDDIKLMEMLKNKEVNKSMSEVANSISNAFKTILALDNINKK